MRNLRPIWLLAFAFMGCALRSDVAITPAFLLPKDIQNRGATVVEAEKGGDYGRAVQFGSAIDSRQKRSARDLIALGSAELAAGRFDRARRHLREALDLRPSREQRGTIAWGLSQTEYLSNNFAASLDWARMAAEHGVQVRDWHFGYLEALSDVHVYEFPSRHAAVVEMEMGSPDIPRLPVSINDGHQVTAVLDTGAVMTIVSRSMAERTGVRSVGDLEGTFVGLLGEPIAVRFGLLDSLVLGDLEVKNVPVAIMADEKLAFFVFNREPFRMELLLGANLLKEFRTELDFRHEVITFQPLHPSMRQPADDQNLFFVSFRPFVQAAINRRGWYLFILDTGSEVTFLNGELIDATPVRRAIRYHGATLQGLGGAKKRGEKVEDVEVSVDAWGGRFRDIPLYSTEQPHAYGILGQNFLKHFRVVIDFGTMRLDLYRDRGPFRRSVFEAATR